MLQQANEIYAEGNMADLEKEGMIQRFEFCLELAWKHPKTTRNTKILFLHKFFQAELSKKPLPQK